MAKPLHASETAINADDASREAAVRTDNLHSSVKAKGTDVYVSAQVGPNVA